MGSARIRGELLKLGFEIAQSSLGKYACLRAGFVLAQNPYDLILARPDLLIIRGSSREPDSKFP